MSSNSLILVCALVFARVAYPAEIKCPSYEGKHPLVSVVVYDGPPEEKADLMPDSSTGKGSQAVSTWDVGYIFGSGRNLFLVCHFSGLPESKNVTVKVETKVERCVFRAPGPHRPAEASCK